MTFFSRCDASQFLGAGPRRARARAGAWGLWGALSGFAEELGILARYAAGLDYYGRGKPGR